MAYNPYIVVPFATWAVAQVAKFTLAAIGGRIDFRNLYASGGMPSVHSAVVCSLVVTALLVDGPNSGIFGFAAIFAAIVMYDSFGVRRSSGEQAVAINMLIETMDRGKLKLEQPTVRLREILGHQPSEVAIGAVVGIVLGGLFNYTHLGPLFTFFQGVPKGLELYIYGAIFAVTVIAGIVQQLVLRAKYRKSQTMRQLTRRILTASQTVGWLGLAAVWVEYERASYLSWRLWSLLVLAIGLVWAVTLLVNSLKTVPAALAAEANTARKLKWLSWGRKGKTKRA